MKRSGFSRARVTPMRRTGRLRAKRVKPGVTGRPSMGREDWELIKQALWQRAAGRCEVPWCRTAKGPLDPHHRVKRSAGGSDELGNLVLLCRPHHDQTDVAYPDGRLLVAPGPTFQIVWAQDKFMARAASACSIEPSAPAGATSRGGGRSRRSHE